MPLAPIGLGNAAVGVLPFSSPKTSSPNLSSAWKSPTMGGDQPEAICAFPFGTSMRNMLMRQTSPGLGGSLGPSVAIPLTSSSGIAISTVQPLS